MAPDGSGERLLTGGYAEGPTWAPNGRAVMFTRGAGRDRGPQLYYVDVAGRNLRQVPTAGASDPPGRGCGLRSRQARPGERPEKVRR